MIDGRYELDLTCAARGDDCHRFRKVIAINERQARAGARMAGWLFKGEDVFCPKCAGAHRPEPRYPGRAIG
jgi:hypothetical protein